jgi:hypothetical protein
LNKSLALLFLRVTMKEADWIGGYAGTEAANHRKRGADVRSDFNWTIKKLLIGADADH